MGGGEGCGEGFIRYTDLPQKSLSEKTHTLISTNSPCFLPKLEQIISIGDESVKEIKIFEFPCDRAMFCDKKTHLLLEGDPTMNLKGKVYAENLKKSTEEKLLAHMAFLKEKGCSVEEIQKNAFIRKLKGTIRRACARLEAIAAQEKLTAERARIKAEKLAAEKAAHEAEEGKETKPKEASAKKEKREKKEKAPKAEGQEKKEKKEQTEMKGKMEN
jgi:hypothetical protein